MHQMTPIAAGLASLGRGDDKMLVHMTPGEVQGLQALAMAHGGSLTINPQTGLPEAGFLSDILPSIVGVGLSFMGVPAWGIGLGTGLTSLATGKDLGTALTSGLLAGAGSALFGGGADAAVGTTPPPVAEIGAGNAAVNTTAANLMPQASVQNLAPSLFEGTTVPGLSLQNLNVLPPGSPLLPNGGMTASADVSPLNDLTGMAIPTPNPASASGPLYDIRPPTEVTPSAAAPNAAGSNTSMTTFNTDPFSPNYGQKIPGTLPVVNPRFIDDPLKWMSQNKGKTALLGLGALGALGGLKQQPLNVAALPQQGGVNYRPQGMNVRPYDPTAPGGYYFTDRGFPQAVYAARGGEMHSVPELEDGGFVLTKKAVDGIGKGSNERGQRAAAAGLGAIPIRGPGTGTSDSIPTTIDGRRPALVSNGEAYVPRNQVKRRGGAKKFYALMRQAEQAAARQV